MKVIDIAIKDMRQSFRSYFALAFMFGVPVLITGMFYFMFGGPDEDATGPELARIQVQVANLDQGGLAGPVSDLGEVVVQILQGEDLASLLDVTLAPDAASARRAVDRQEAAVAVVIPEDFTAALTSPGQETAIELYQDPTLTLGPSIVGSILRQVIDGFSATRIGIEVAAGQLAQAGMPLDGDGIQSLARQFLALSGAQDQPDGGPASHLEVRSPAGSQGNANLFQEVINKVFSGMMVFFVYFTGAAAAQSILREEERGTLPRLFTTPVPRRTILGGKALAVVLLLVVQLGALMAFGALVFGIPWGGTLATVVVALGIVASAACLGLFLVSFLRTSRQGGVIFGGVLTITGMLGMVEVFVVNPASMMAGLDTLALLVPQGWAMKTLLRALEGRPWGEMLPLLAGTLTWSLVMGLVAFRRLRRRFA